VRHRPLLESRREGERRELRAHSLDRRAEVVEGAVLVEHAFDWLDAPIERVGAKFAPLAFAPAMEQFVIPQPADVLAAVKKTLTRT